MFHDGISSARQRDWVNPLIFGNFADPSILRDGDAYYLVHGGRGYRRMRLWRSTNLVSWDLLYPIFDGPCCSTSCWAPELVRVADTYYLYNYGQNEFRSGVYVMTTHSIETGPWSEPIFIDGVQGIDPGHVVERDGTRYLFVSGNTVYPLSLDGVTVAGPAVRVLDDWPIPDSWDVECTCTESPKLTWHDGWLYLTTAQGGTLGPATSHMILSARARSVHGPWEYSPHNPISHTNTRNDPWWSRGHGTLIEAPDGSWFVVYHAIMNGHRNLGRMTLMDPVEWTDGWWRIAEPREELSTRLGDTNGTTRKAPDPGSDEHLRAREPRGGTLVRSDAFRGALLGPQWDPVTSEQADRIRFTGDGMVVAAGGTSLHTTTPVLCLPGHTSYCVEADLDVESGAIGGLTLYYDGPHSCGIALFDGRVILYNMQKTWLQNDRNTLRWESSRISLRLTTNGIVVTPWYSRPGGEWMKLNVCFDVEGWHHNAIIRDPDHPGLGDLRPGVFAAGRGCVRFLRWRYVVSEGPG